MNFKKRIYLDNASTTPLDKRVLASMKPFMTKWYGNPSSNHLDGIRAYYAINTARDECARALGCSTDEIFFTSGASESNSWVSKIVGIRADSKSHDSMILACNTHKDDYQYYYSIPLINNETGEDNSDNLPNDKIIHLDLTQAIGKVPINLQHMLCVQFASLAAHKFGGPKGVGLLYIAKGFQENHPVNSLIYGHQEQGMRGGTENVAGIVGLGKAITLATSEMNKNNSHIQKLVAYIKSEVNTLEYLSEGRQILAMATLLGHIQIDKSVKKLHTSHNIINITFKYLDAQTAVALLDKYGISVSAGSACHSFNDKPSEVLVRSGYTEEEALKTIRISIGKQNTMKEVKYFCKILHKIIDTYDVSVI